MNQNIVTLAGQICEQTASDKYCHLPNLPGKEFSELMLAIRAYRFAKKMWNSKGLGKLALSCLSMKELSALLACLKMIREGAIRE